MDNVSRPHGMVELLIGYDYAGWHPVREASLDHLLILSNVCGKCLGGTHPSLKESTEKAVMNIIVNHKTLSDFFGVLAMGVECYPKGNGNWH